MASTSGILGDNSLVSRADRILLRLELVFALLSGIAVFTLMLLAVISVSGRNFFNSPLPGYVDWIEQAMPLIAFLGVSYVQREGGHIRMDLVINRFKGRSLWAVELVTTLIVLVLMALLVWGSWAHFSRSFDFSQPMWSRDSSMDIGLPLWPSKLLVSVAFSVLVLRLALQVWAYGRAFATGAENPAAVPLPIDAATLAAIEAEHVSGHDQ